MKKQWKFDDPDPINRFEQFAAFADWWFEFDTRTSALADLDIDKELNGFVIPDVLRQLYEAARRWPFEDKTSSGYEKTIFGWCQNYFSYPDKLIESKLYSERGLITFAFENQGVTDWACVGDEIDPHVWDREAEHVDGDESYPYSGTCSTSLANFLIMFLLNEFALNGSWVRTTPEFKEYINSQPAEWQTLMTDEFGMMPEVGLLSDEVLVSTNPYGWVVTPRQPEASDILKAFMVK